MINITKLLTEAPSKIAYHQEQAGKHYAEMIKLHEEYKRAKYKLYLELKAQGTSANEAEPKATIEKTITQIKDLELQAEINYRAERQKQDYWNDQFEMAKELGYNKRAQIRSLNDTVKEEL